MRAILTYHSIDESGSAISISRALFAEQVRRLARGGTPVVPLPELLRRDPAECAVALTFDDAFRNFETVAWPLLVEYGFPATLFTATSHVGGYNDWKDLPGIQIPRLPLLDWESLGRLAEEGVTLGAHSITHPDLTTTDDSTCHRELAGSADEIERRTGRRVDAVAYPYGAVDGRVSEVARGRFLYGCTTELRWLRPTEDFLQLPRIDAYYLRDLDLIDRWGTPWFRAVLQIRASARRVRKVLTRWGAS